MKNACKTIPFGKILLILWLLVATFFTIESLWNRGLKASYIQGVNDGNTGAVNRLMVEALDEKCDSFQVFSGQNKVDLVNLACLQKAITQPPSADMPNVEQPMDEVTE